MKSFLLLLPFLALASGQCLNGGVLINDFCSCSSSFYSPTCEIQLGGCTMDPADPLHTQPLGEFMMGDSGISANTFTFRIASPLVGGRVFTDILFGNCQANASHFQRIDSGFCEDTLVGAYSIPDVTACGFAPSSDASFTFLTGDISLTSEEPVGTFRGVPVVRTQSSHRAITLRLPRNVVLDSSNITIAGAIDLMAAVVTQSYDEMTGEVTIQILTSVQYPYKVTLATPALSPINAIVGEALVTDTDCLDESGDCVQTSTLTISGFGGDFCFLNGNYSIDFDYSCRPGVVCPVEGGAFVNVEYILESEDLCATVEFESTISGSMTTFADPAHTITSQAFLSGETIYLLADLSADVVISSVTVNSVSGVINRGLPFSLAFLDAEHPSGPGFGRAISITPVLGVELPAQDLVVLDVFADLTVTYATSFKRDLVTKDVSLSQMLVITSQ